MTLRSALQSLVSDAARHVKHPKPAHLGSFRSEPEVHRLLPLKFPAATAGHEIRHWSFRFPASLEPALPPSEYPGPHSYNSPKFSSNFQTLIPRPGMLPRPPSQKRKYPRFKPPYYTPNSPPPPHMMLINFKATHDDRCIYAKLDDGEKHFCFDARIRSIDHQPVSQNFSHIVGKCVPARSSHGTGVH